MARRPHGNLKVFRKWGSHMPLLMALVPVTTGTILELGCGFFSTPFLHWSCRSAKRTLISYDGIHQWARTLQNFNRAKYHTLEYVDDWDALKLPGPYGLALVDHSPAERRGRDVVRLADVANIILAHDGAPPQQPRYGYDAIPADAFKYRYLYAGAWPHTLVLSNSSDPAELLPVGWLGKET